LGKNRYIFIPPAFDAPLAGVLVEILPYFLWKKTRIVWLPDGVKKFDMFSHFNRIPACDGRTDRQTDEHIATA